MPADKADLVAREVKNVDFRKNTFDGEKADISINTGKLGKTFLVRIPGADGKPVLIAMHL